MAGLPALIGRQTGAPDKKRRRATCGPRGACLGVFTRSNSVVSPETGRKNYMSVKSKSTHFYGPGNWMRTIAGATDPLEEMLGLAGPARVTERLGVAGLTSSIV